MRGTSPHRKRRAATGRLANAVVVLHNIINVSSTPGDSYSCDRVAIKDGTSVKTVDARQVIGTEHRNRFGADHQMSIVTSNIAPCRRLLDKIRHTFPAVKFDQQIDEIGMITIKVQSGGSDMLRFINGSKISGLFRVETAFCGDRDSACATTMRHTHAPAYRK